MRGAADTGAPGGAAAGAVRRPRLARAASLGLLVLLAATAAAADGGRATFWEQALAPHREEVEGLLDRADLLTRKGDAAALARARDALERAVDLAPRAPLPRWRLAAIHRREGAFAACARHLRRIADIAPRYQPPGSTHDTPLLLDFTFAGCLGKSGEFALAADRLHRILARGITGDARIHRRLGHVEMARGRLDAAIRAFERARRLRPHSAGLRFALAMAFDRAEMPADARAHLSSALARDPHMKTARSPAADYFPPADEHYLRGLARAAQGRPARAIVLMRHYLAETPDAPWRRRARAHLERLLEADVTAGSLSIAGTASLDPQRTRAAVAAADDALQRCVRDTPNLLLRARLTLVVGSGGGEGRPRPGTRVLVDHAFSTPTSDLRAAVECVETAARRLDLPALRGNRGQYATVELHVVSR